MSDEESDYETGSDEDQQSQVKPAAWTDEKNPVGSAYMISDPNEQQDYNADAAHVMKAMDVAMSRERRRRPKVGSDGHIVPGSDTSTCREAIKDFMDDSGSSHFAAAFHTILLLAIVASTFLVVIETVPAHRGQIPHTDEINLYFSIFFTAEFVVRVLVSESCRDMCADPFLWIDLAAVLPFWLEEAFSLQGGVLFDILRAMRILRLLKLTRQFDHESIILIRAIQISWEALIVPFFFLAVFIVAATVLFYVEREGARQETAANYSGTGVTIDAAFSSIPDAIWFMFVTMTTVGYGDVSPVTSAGKGVCIVCMIFGVVFLAMPLSIVGNNFVEVWADRERVIFIEKLKESLASGGVNAASFTRAFDDLDGDGSGSLSKAEFKTALQSLDLKWPPKQLNKLWNAVDADKSGEVQKKEFLELLGIVRDDDDDEESSIPLAKGSDALTAIQLQLKAHGDALTAAQKRNEAQFADLAKQIEMVQRLLMNSTITRSEFKQESFKVSNGRNPAKK